MLISYNWLKDFTNIKDSPERLAQQLTMAGIEVSSLEKIKMILFMMQRSHPIDQICCVLKDCQRSCLFDA